MMNPAPPYAAGSGVAHVWLAYREAATIDRLRISAYDENWTGIGGRFAVSLEWRDGAPGSARTPANWAQDMSDRQQWMAVDAMMTADGTDDDMDDDMAVGWMLLLAGLHAATGR